MGVIDDELSESSSPIEDRGVEIQPILPIAAVLGVGLH
jgi:hypothetical protein